MKEMVRFRIQSIPANHSDCSFQLRNEAALEWKPDLPLLAQRIRSIPVTNGVCWLGCAPARCRHISRSTLAQNNKWRYSTDTARTRNFIQIVGEKWCKGKYQLLAEAYMRDVQHHYTRCYRNRSALSGPLGIWWKCIHLFKTIAKIDLFNEYKWLLKSWLKVREMLNSFHWFVFYPIVVFVFLFESFDTSTGFLLHL